MIELNGLHIKPLGGLLVNLSKGTKTRTNKLRGTNLRPNLMLGFQKYLMLSMLSCCLGKFSRNLEKRSRLRGESFDIGRRCVSFTARRSC